MSITISYRRVGDLDLLLDLYVPPGMAKGRTLPAVIYLHGGGLTCGSRHDLFFPAWLKDGTLARGFIFIAADYRLVHPSTGLDIIDDMKALFSFLARPSFSSDYLPDGIALDPTRMAVAGLSGGAYCARAAALYANPKPKALFSIFGMGGDFLSDHWLAEKDDFLALFPKCETVTDASIAHLTGPERSLAPVSDLPLAACADGTIIDQAQRLWLFTHSWRKGVLLDYVLGESVSATLRAHPASKRLAAIPAHLRPAIPEANIDTNFPPTVLVHGANDHVVLPSESEATYHRLRELGVRTEIYIVPNADHGLYYVPDTNHKLSLKSTLVWAPGVEGVLDKTMDFLGKELLGGHQYKL